MNSKRAKKLRALVKHLQTRGAINENWVTAGSDKKSGARMNDPACGRSIYQAMKKRDLLNSK
jgi:hypothetical protein